MLLIYSINFPSHQHEYLDVTKNTQTTIGNELATFFHRTGWMQKNGGVMLR